jgi:dolichol-phosphate mannosyltransferase
VLVPTLNEAENIDILLEGVFQVRSRCGIDFDVLFVDSASDDNTCDCIRGWIADRPVSLLQREINVGLAGAVLAGARHCCSDIVLVMDADLSHPAEKIPLLLAPVMEGTHDMVIGSRYVPGGSVPGWPFSRRLCSRVATLPALFFCTVKDPLAGFFAVKRSFICNLEGSVPGFKIGLAILAQYGTELRVKEIPIEFRDRGHGESKMNRAVVWDYLRQLSQLSVNRLRHGRR